MTTRSRNGISKPKHLLSLNVVATSSSSVPLTEPTHFLEAVKHSVWQEAMAEDCISQYVSK